MSDRSPSVPQAVLFTSVSAATVALVLWIGSELVEGIQDNRTAISECRLSVKELKYKAKLREAYRDREADKGQEADEDLDLRILY